MVRSAVTRVCQVCGRSQRPQAPSCSSCDGVGTKPLFTSLVDCDACEGSGEQKLTPLEVQRLICEMLKCPGCRARLAASMQYSSAKRSA